jgi:WD40 repeat protein
MQQHKPGLGSHHHPAPYRAALLPTLPNANLSRVPLVHLLLLSFSLCIVIHRNSSAEDALTSPATTETRVQRIPPLPGMKESPVIAALALDRQGDLVAVAGDDHSIRLLQQSTSQELAVLRGHRGWIQCLQFSEVEGILISGSNDGEVWLWNQAKQWQGTRILKSSFGITALAFHPDGQRIAVASFDAVPIMIDKSGAKLSELTTGCTDTRCLLFSNDGLQLAAGGRDGRLCIWEVGESGLVSETPNVAAKIHQRRIHALSFSKDSSLVYSAGEDKDLVQYDRLLDEERNRIGLRGLKALSLVMISDHLVAVGGADNSIRIVDMIEKGECSRLVGHQGSVVTMRCQGDELITGSFDTTIRRWSIQQALDASEIDAIPITKKPGTDSSLPTR